MDIKARITDLKEHHIDFHNQKLYLTFVYEINYTQLYGTDMWKKINLGEIDEIIKSHLSGKVDGRIKLLDFTANKNSAEFIYEILIEFDELIILEEK